MRLKKHLMNITGAVVTVLLVGFMVQRLGVFLDPDWSQGGLDAVNAFHTLEEDSLDVIIYGSSHAWKGCDTRVMCEEYGFNAYNYGCNWQSSNTTLLFLKDSLQTQSPKVVCIETFNMNTILWDCDLEGQIYYTRAIPDFEGKQEYLEQCFQGNRERYLTYEVPLVLFHDEWTQIDAENFTLPDVETCLNNKGFVPLTGVNAYEMEDYRTFDQSELEEGCVRMMDEMVSVCKEKGIEVIFYTCPYVGEYHYSDALKRYAEQKDCVYLDLFAHMDEMGFDANTDYNDPGHLNTSGSGKVARFLADYIVANYDMENL